MSCDVLIGAQWGDEGKAKAIDFISPNYKYIARYQGGANAGHTVIIGKQKFIFHLIPSSILNESTHGLITNGVVVDPVELLNEIDTLEKHNISVDGRLWVSENAHVVLPYHKTLDNLREERLREGRIGTTGRGIGPCYVDKYNRTGIRMQDLLRDDLNELIRSVVEEKNFFIKQYYKSNDVYDADQIADDYRKYGDELAKHITDTRIMLNEALLKNENVLFEGAQGLGLDIDFGTYPFVTSSNSSTTGVSSGSGIPPTKIDNVFGIFKAYLTRVGEGFFPTELKNKYGTYLQEKGHEYGSTTGRPRRCGWFDLPFAKYSCEINDVKEIILTKLDVLDDLETVFVCTGYEYEGDVITSYSPSSKFLKYSKPVYKKLKGWKTNIENIKTFSELPVEAQNYVKYIEEELNTDMKIISVGPERNNTILID